MIPELTKIQNLFSEVYNCKATNIMKDAEASEYSGYNFNINNLQFIFRKAKITPKKVGQFVTLWKRNSLNQTEPYNQNDNVDFYIVETNEDKNYGFFLFAKADLVKHNILSTHIKQGKRGFRVYPNWTKTDNNQALKTQKWQTEHFFDFKDGNYHQIQKLKSILINKLLLM